MNITKQCTSVVKMRTKRSADVGLCKKQQREPDSAESSGNEWSVCCAAEEDLFVFYCCDDIDNDG